MVQFPTAFLVGFLVGFLAEFLGIFLTHTRPPLTNQNDANVTDAESDPSSPRPGDEDYFPDEVRDVDRYVAREEWATTDPTQAAPNIGGWDTAANTRLTVAQMNRANEPMKSWGDPLLRTSDLMNHEHVAVKGVTLAFFSRLAATPGRRMNAPFLVRQALAEEIMYMLERALFNYVMKERSDWLRSLRVDNAEQLELNTWKLVLQVLKLVRGEDPTDVSETIGGFRHIAVHHKSYSTGHMKAIMSCLDMIEDLGRARKLQRRLKSTYLVTSFNTNASLGVRLLEEERLRDRAFADLLKSQPITPHHVLAKTLTVIETLLYRFCQNSFVSSRMPEKIYSEGTELKECRTKLGKLERYWETPAEAEQFKTLLGEVNELRNRTAHRNNDGLDLMPQAAELVQMLRVPYWHDIDQSSSQRTTIGIRNEQGWAAKLVRMLKMRYGREIDQTLDQTSFRRTTKGAQGQQGWDDLLAEVAIMFVTDEARARHFLSSNTNGSQANPHLHAHDPTMRHSTIPTFNKWRDDWREACKLYEHFDTCGGSDLEKGPALRRILASRLEYLEHSEFDTGAGAWPDGTQMTGEEEHWRWFQEISTPVTNTPATITPATNTPATRTPATQILTMGNFLIGLLCVASVSIANWPPSRNFMVYLLWFIYCPDCETNFFRLIGVLI